jgi:hypothetical protein
MTIGTIIVDFLTANANLLALVPEVNIFPVVANEDTPMPFIIYRYSVSGVEYSKDGFLKDNCDFNVLAVSGDYANLQLIITQIRLSLELQQTSDTNRIGLAGIDEPVYGDGMYVQKLNFNVVINKY